MKSRCTFCVLFILVLLLISVLLAPRLPARAVTLQKSAVPIDQVAQSPDAQNDVNGIKELSFAQDEAQAGARHVSGAPQALSPEGDWCIECVDCPKRFWTNTNRRNLQLDRDGYPHITYGGDHLYHAWYDGNTWHRETVDQAGDVGSDASLALDAADNPHIAYSGSGLKYAHWTGNAWYIQTVDSGEWKGHISLALDAAGNPHISYLRSCPKIS